MSATATRGVRLVLAMALAGCTGTASPPADDDEPGAPSQPSGMTTEPSGEPTPPSAPAAPPTAPVPAGAKFDWATITAPQTEAYLAKLAPSVVGRVLSPAERTQIQAQKGAAIAPIVAAWVKEPGFPASVRLMIEQNLNVSGRAPSVDAAGKPVEVDFDLPGNLAAFIVKNERPWSEIVTAQSCYDRTGKAIACDTGAPYAAGLLTTRAFMISRASRFNLTRASAIMKNFACRAYPMEPELQPRIEKPALIPMFQAETPEEQTDDRARAGFGNGFGCYTCHGQFSVHAQLFVKFDKNGLFQSAATGLQDPKGELGRSINGLMASHLKDPARAKSEQTPMYGKTVANLAEAAKVMVDAPVFLECQAQRYLDHVLGLAYGAVSYDANLFASVATRAKTAGRDPTFSQIAVALLTEPVVVTSVVKSLTGGSP